MAGAQGTGRMAEAATGAGTKGSETRDHLNSLKRRPNAVSIPQTTGKGDSRKKLLTPSSQNTPQRASPAGPGQNFNLTVDGSSSGTSPRTRIGRRKKKAGAPTPPSQIFLEAVVTPERQKVRCGWRC